MAEADAPPGFISDLVAACSDYVYNALKLELDFELETLPLLDHYLRDAAATAAERPEAVELIARSAGAYFGELIRRRLDGFWILPSEDSHSWRVCGRHEFLSINPVGVVYDALFESSEHGGPSGQLRIAPEDRESVGARLDNLPEVSDEDYYLLSTRLEVIEVAADELRRAMEHGGQSDVTFDESDYTSDD